VKEYKFKIQVKMADKTWKKVTGTAKISDQDLRELCGPECVIQARLSKKPFECILLDVEATK